MSGFLWPARVYWEDTDAGGIVYYANYLRFLERARTEWLRERGISQQSLALEENVMFTVVSLQAHYHRPARLDDLLLVSCDSRREGGASLAFEQQIWRRTATASVGGAATAMMVASAAAPGPSIANAAVAPSRLAVEPDSQLLLSASVRAACLDARTMKPRRLPPVILRGLS